jgi:hypothetical protein
MKPVGAIWTPPPNTVRNLRMCLTFLARHINTTPENLYNYMTPDMYVEKKDYKANGFFPATGFNRYLWIRAREEIESGDVKEMPLPGKELTMEQKKILDKHFY